MNKAKARDFFSDYYEGSLDPGLRQVFERSLAADSTLKADYDEFCLLMKDLSSLSAEEVPEPAFLSERIASQISLKLTQSEAPAKPAWWLGWGKIAFAGAAALALVSVLVASKGRPGEFVGSFLPGFDRKVEVPGRAVVKDGTVRIEALASDFMIVTVRRAKTGEAVDRFRLEGWQALDIPLTNEGSGAEIILVEFSNGRPDIRLALPGSTRKSELKGAGTVDELAIALADTYELPVQIEAPSPSMPVTWTFEAGSPVGASVSSAKGPALTVEERKGPLLFIN